jgi:HEAT repeat protein
MLVNWLLVVLTLLNSRDMEINSFSQEEQKALAELHKVLKNSEKFVKVHAAEFLIWTGHKEEALKEFLKEDQLRSGEAKYRITIWRVLVQAEDDASRKQMWLDKIYRAYADLDGPDRTHATETLAKLKQPVSELFPKETAFTLKSEDRNLQTYALWAAGYDRSGQLKMNRDVFVDKVLEDEDVIIRRISAFVLRQVKGVNVAQWNRLTDAALSQTLKDDTFVTFLITSLVTAPEGADKQKLLQVEQLLLKDVKSYDLGQRMEQSQALAERGTDKHLPLLMDILENKACNGYDPASEEAADLRATAAYAILKIKSR